MHNSHIILALEASAGQATAAVMRDGNLLAETCHQARHGHATWMLTLVQDCLSQGSVSMEEVTAVVAGRGPGSFTGIRVALAAAKGLAIARQVPGYGLNSLSAMALLVADGRRPVAVLADTRRGSVFTAIHDPDGTPRGDILDLGPDRLVAHLAGSGFKGQEWIIVGHLPADLEPNLKTAALAAELRSAEPSAAALCQQFASFVVVDPATCPLTPLYLSEPLLGPA